MMCSVEQILTANKKAILIELHRLILYVYGNCRYVSRSAHYNKSRGIILVALITKKKYTTTSLTKKCETTIWLTSSFIRT